jgi:hypothetical protein
MAAVSQSSTTPPITTATNNRSVPFECHNNSSPFLQVSWLRPRENEILTAGKYTYVSDPRISAINENGSTDWVLEIKDVGLNDSTSYECQVSTDPKLSQIFNLQVQGKLGAVSVCAACCVCDDCSRLTNCLAN